MRSREDDEDGRPRDARGRFARGKPKKPKSKSKKLSKPKSKFKTKKLSKPKSKLKTKKLAKPRTSKKLGKPKPKSKRPGRRPGRRPRPARHPAPVTRQLALPSEVLLSKLLELRERFRQSGRTRISYGEEEVIWHLDKPEGYSISIPFGEVLDERSIRHIVEKSMNAAEKIEDAMPGGRIHSAIFLTEYGKNLVGSPKATLYVDQDGEMIESVQGTPGVEIHRLRGVFEGRLRSMLEKTERNAVIVEEVTFRNYRPRKEK